MSFDPAMLEMSDQQIDDLEFQNLQIEGGLILSSFRDKFEFYPLAGHPGTGTLEEVVGFDLSQRRITGIDRRRIFTFKYTPDGESYTGQFFTRVQAGKQTK